MNKNQIKDILYRYTQGLSNQQEIKAVETWYDQLESHATHKLDDDSIDQIGLRMRKHLYQHGVPFRRRKIIALRIYTLIGVTVAACVLLFFLWDRSADSNPAVIQAGTDKAVLTIGNREAIDLNQLTIGQSIDYEGIRIRKTQEGEIVYEVLSPSLSKTAVNQLHVPKGGKFRVVLPDGSTVWINSDSDVRYGSSFGETHRQVELEGEAYFEVARDEQKPFIVKTSRAAIKVLGTKFNIQAYANEPLWTTTVTHGRVSVSNGSRSVILNKDEQVRIHQNGHIDHVATDSFDPIAWQDGNFHFNGTSIAAIARQVERWYAIPVEVDDRVKDLEFYGIIPRQETANQLFEILQETNTIAVQVMQNKIMIYPKKTN